jgi:Hemerythrin HHE cation binding domain
MTRSVRGKPVHGNPVRGSDVIDVLKSQHTEIRRAFRRAAVPGPTRQRAFRHLVRLLAIHEAAEEAHVHPTARRVIPNGRAVSAARRAEEKEAKRLLTGLWRTRGRGAAYLPTLRALRKAVLAHAAREEREEFPALGQRVSDPRRRLLGLEVRLASAIAPTRPHRFFNNEVANKLAAPVFGPIDRMRDVIARRK